MLHVLQYIKIKTELNCFIDVINILLLLYFINILDKHYSM